MHRRLLGLIYNLTSSDVFSNTAELSTASQLSLLLVMDASAFQVATRRRCHDPFGGLRDGASHLTQVDPGAVLRGAVATRSSASAHLHRCYKLKRRQLLQHPRDVGPVLSVRTRRHRACGRLRADHTHIATLLTPSTSCALKTAQEILFTV